MDTSISATSESGASVATINVKRLYVVCFCDPSGGPTFGKKQSGLSRAAITALGCDDKERMIILESFIKRVPPDQLVDKIFEFQQRWKPAVFGIDASGPQLMWYQNLVGKEARERNVKWSPKGVNFKIDKIDTIEKAIQPIASSGRLLRPPERECYPLMEEFRQFPTGQYMDGMDSLAHAILLMPTVLPTHMRMYNDTQLRAFLMRMGFNKDQIEERIAQNAQFR